MTMRTLAEFALGATEEGAFRMPLTAKAWAIAHVFSGMVAGTLGVYTADQGVINDQTTVTLFAALGFAAFSFIAGWRLSTLFSEQRVKRAANRQEIEQQIRQLADTLDDRMDELGGRLGRIEQEVQ